MDGPGKGKGGGSVRSDVGHPHPRVPSPPTCRNASSRRALVLPLIAIPPRRGSSSPWSSERGSPPIAPQEQRTNVDYFWDELDYEKVQAFAQECVDCKGVIVFTGVGKSGFIAHKISQTLVSTGTKAVFLPPTDALHGDIGIIGDQDLLVLLFKAGDEDELIKLVPYAKVVLPSPPLSPQPSPWMKSGCRFNKFLTANLLVNPLQAKGAKLVSVTTRHDNPLAEHCDLNVELPLKREICPFNMEPATSTSLQILFGDTVAIAVMQARQVTQQEYAMNHPSGKLGKQLILHVGDIMATGRQVPKANVTDKVVDVLMELSSKAHGCAVVVDEDGILRGSFTDGDLRRTLQSRGEETLELQVAEVMHKNPKTVREDLMAVDAMVLMNSGERRVSFLPVTDNKGHVTGILTLHMCVSAGL